MKNISRNIAAIICCLVILTGCTVDIKAGNDNSPETHEIRTVSDFDGISVSEGIVVELTMSDSIHVEVIAPEEFINNVKTENDGSTLKIHIRDNSIRLHKRKITVRVSAKTINHIKVSSGSKLFTKNTIETKNLELKCSSGAELVIDSKTITNICHSSSGSGAKLSGITENFNGDASSGSNINGTNLKCMKANTNASSGGNISISVQEELKANASSGGSIKYTGSPKIKDFKKSSGGSVHQK